MKKLIMIFTLSVVASFAYAGNPAILTDLEKDSKIEVISDEMMDEITGTATVYRFRYGFIGNKRSIHSLYDIRYWTYTRTVMEYNNTGTPGGKVYVHEGRADYITWSGLDGTKATHLLGNYAASRKNGYSEQWGTQESMFWGLGMSPRHYNSRAWVIPNPYQYR